MEGGCSSSETVSCCVRDGCFPLDLGFSSHLSKVACEVARLDCLLPPSLIPLSRLEDRLVEFDLLVLRVSFRGSEREVESEEAEVAVTVVCQLELVVERLEAGFELAREHAVLLELCLVVALDDGELVDRLVDRVVPLDDLGLEEAVERLVDRVVPLDDLGLEEAVSAV